MYIDYINQSTNPMNEPFLIPEFRYAGLERKHIYRLDFTILNIHTDEKVGFEISPQSTHMNVKTINKTKLIDVNKDLSNKWSKEMQKRNDYFSEFDISMITFTDKELEDMPKCFEVIKSYLEKRREITENIPDLIDDIMQI